MRLYNVNGSFQNTMRPRLVLVALLIAVGLDACGSSSSSFTNSSTLASSIRTQASKQGQGVDTVQCQSIVQDQTTCTVDFLGSGGIDTQVQASVSISSDGRSYTATFPDGSTVSARQ